MTLDKNKKDYEDTIGTTGTQGDEAAAIRARNRHIVELFMRTGLHERLERHRLYVENGSAVLWFTDVGGPIVVQGRDNLRKHGQLSIQVLPDWRWYDVSIIETMDPNMIWVECRGEGTIRFPGYPEGHYRNQFLHCFDLNDGSIVQSREISNPIEQMRSLGIDVPRIERGWIPSQTDDNDVKDDVLRRLSRGTVD